MTPKELTEKTIKDIAQRREKAEKDFYGYQKDQTLKKKKKWSTRYGGFRF